MVAVVMVAVVMVAVVMVAVVMVAVVMVAAMVVVVGQRDYGKHCACLSRKKLDCASVSQSVDA